MSEVPPPPTAPANYKDTLNLPKTAFEMKANLTQREPAMVKQWQTEGIYQKVRGRKHPKGKWVLHDGPPYANGDIHMGHLINKVLKDIVVKFRTMQGHDSPYVPGWDCHGLPIESAIQKSLGPKFRELSKDEVRKQCHDYAMKYVKLQSESFERLGVFGDYARPYLTLDPKYEAGIMEVLAELVKRDLVYRQKKPVHWCVNDRTALAEAELEYQTKKDSSVYVNFSVNNGALGKTVIFVDPTVDFAQAPAATIPNLPVHLMIWTTTPWTLPANRAVAVHKKFLYALVQYTDPTRGDILTIVAQDLVKEVFKERAYQVIGKATGDDLLGLTYSHPIDTTRSKQPVVDAEYVLLGDGTGLVHTAPGHGKEDYQTGMKYGLEIYNPVLPDGRYDDTVPEFLRGKSIWDANQLIIDKLKESGTLFHLQIFDHEYPHCWRCRKPVIFRATEQWFVKASRGAMTDAQMTAFFEKPTFPKSESYDETREASKLWYQSVLFTRQVEFIPDWGRNRLEGMLATRPDWCISRQRSWGVPIPAFFDPQGKSLLTEASVRKTAAYFREHGADSWYTDSPEKILGGDAAVVGFPAGTDMKKLDKGQDILDVWFESGASHHAVLECTHPELGYPAEMYLEGSDQHRGWFQSSLLEASGYKSVPPFKQVLTHGFVVDEKGRKMSKSEGNDIKVDAALKQYGADVLRLWVSSVDYQNDIPCGPHLLAKTGEAYRKIRNTIRYLLGNLYDFDPEQNHVDPRPHSIDAWMQTKIYAWASEVQAAYDRYEFHAVFRLIYEFCNVEISAVYAKAIKDRLYCELPDSPKRRASQSVCYDALIRLIELSAPVLAFTAEEAWAEVRKLPGAGSLESSIHLRELSEVPELSKKGINPFTKKEAVFESSLAHAQSHWAILMPLVERGNKQLDDLKRTIGLGNALDAEAVIVVPTVSDDVTALINEYGPEVEDALGVGFHRIEHGEVWDIKVNDTRQKYESCARSWKRRPDVGSDREFADLSARDAKVVRTLRGK